MKLHSVNNITGARRMGRSEGWLAGRFERRPFGADRQLAAGIALALLTATISGFSVFVNSYAVKEFPSGTVFAAVKNTIVGVMLLALILRPATLKEVRRLTPGRGLWVAVLGIVGGSVPFVLFFEGLREIGPGNAAFIHKTLFLWVAVLSVLFLRERLGKGHLAALALLLLAHLLMGGPIALAPSISMAMVLAATLFWALETAIARRVLTTMSSSLGASSRMVIGAGLLLGYLAATGQIGVLWHLTAVQWGWALATSVLLLGYVLAWYGALKRAPATTVTCVLTAGAPITAGLTAFGGMGLPDPQQLAGYAIVALAVSLLVFATVRRREPDLPKTPVQYSV